MIRISQLKLPITHKPEELQKKIIKTLRIPEGGLLSFEIEKRSIDARHKKDILYVYTVDVILKKEIHLAKSVYNNNIMLTNKKKYEIQVTGTEVLTTPPIIIGSGPAGLFCGYLLAKAGYRPLILERGDEAQKRMEKVEHFWKTGQLDLDSNVQFGEGGAGTFSDGKLNTLVKDPIGRNRKVLELFVEAGAPLEILYQQKPHLGTDILVEIVQNLRKMITDMGGEFRFRTQLTDIEIENQQIKAIEINHKERIETSVLIPAIGHSARDTFEMLLKKGIHMEAKSFAIGLRIEHPQTMINISQYGVQQQEELGPASYKLTHKLKNERGIYTFCMCPGGYIVNAASEKGRLAINGMSYQDRAGENANSALIVTVTPEDFPSDEVLAGIAYQRELEEAAYQLGNGAIPVQLFKDFCAKKKSVKLGNITPQIKGAYILSDLRSILPAYIGDSIEEGIYAFDKKIPGFAREDALLSGIESRTSSPVRIVRDNSFESNITGFYPCGEGAGYAGGITSAAMDGLKVGEAIMKRFRNLE